MNETSRNCLDRLSLLQSLPVIVNFFFYENRSKRYERKEMYWIDPSANQYLSFVIWHREKWYIFDMINIKKVSITRADQMIIFIFNLSTLIHWILHKEISLSLSSSMRSKYEGYSSSNTFIFDKCSHIKSIAYLMKNIH